MLLRWWNFLERSLVGVLAVLALTASGYEIVTRYLLPQYAPDWGEEVIVYLVIWAVFLAGSALVAENRHVRADIVLRLFGATGQRALEIFNCAASLLLCLLLAWFGWEVVEFAIMLDERSISSLRFPIALYYACLPIGMLLMSIRYVIRLAALLFAFDPATMTIQEGDITHE